MPWELDSVRGCGKKVPDSKMSHDCIPLGTDPFQFDKAELLLDPIPTLESHSSGSGSEDMECGSDDPGINSICVDSV